MNRKLEEAIKTLRRVDYIICPVLWGGYRVRYPTSTRDEHYTARQLIKFAAYHQGGWVGTGDLKEETHSRNRAATKQSLSHERYEEFQHNKLRATGNPWNWD